MITILFFLCVCVFTTITLAGCDDESVYDELVAGDYDDTVSSVVDDSKEAGDNVIDMTRDVTLKFFSSFKAIAPVIIIVSILVGSCILLVVKNNKKIRKNAIFVLIIGIPLLVIIVVYGSAFILQYIYSKKH